MIVRGTANNDVLTGGDSNDFLVGDAGNDTIDGGNGADIAFFDLPAGITGSLRVVDGTGVNVGKFVVELVDGVVVEAVFIVAIGGSQASVQGVGRAASLGTDTIINVEQFQFGFSGTSIGAVTITSSTIQNGILVSGSEGSDTITLANFVGAINANGNRGDDVITGTDANNNLNGGAGSDTIDGSNGADIAFFDLPPGATGALRVVDGTGSNADKIVVELVNGAVVEAVFLITLNGGQANVQGVGQAASMGTDTVINVEQLQFWPSGRSFAPVTINLSVIQAEFLVSGSQGSDVIALANFVGATNANGNRGDDVITGTDDNNILVGGAGNDMLFGAGGNDSLNGGAGSDTIDGGSGHDIVSYILNQMTAGVTFDARGLSGTGASTLLDPLGGTDTLISIETIIIDGTNFSDVIYGSGSVSSAAEYASEISGNGGDDRLYGGAGRDYLSGDGGNDFLAGGAGDDLLIGRSGSDTLEGGDGSDSLYGAGNLISQLRPGDGPDILRGEGGNDFLLGSADGDRLEGGAGDDNIRGEAGNDTIDGGEGNDRLNGGAGNDIIDGQADFDVAVFTGALLLYEVSRSGSTVTVRDLRPNGDGTDTLTAIERLQFTDGVMGLVPERLMILQPNSRDLLSWDSTLGPTGFTYLVRLGSDTNVAAVADLTGDGRVDLLLQQPGGGLLRWDLTQGGNGFAALTAAPGFTVVGTGDLVGNGASDVLLRDTAGQLRVLDPVTNAISDLLTIAQGFTLKGVANINGSGKLDLIFQNDNSGAVLALTDQGWRDLITLTPSSGWQIAGLGDVVGGLADDFVFRNTATGVVLFWDATQGGQGFRDFATIAQGWNLLTISDLNGDGRDDVAFQNVNGNATYWTGTNWVDLGSVLAGAQLQGTGLFA